MNYRNANSHANISGTHDFINQIIISLSYVLFSSYFQDISVRLSAYALYVHSRSVAHARSISGYLKKRAHAIDNNKLACVFRTVFHFQSDFIRIKSCVWLRLSV